MARVVLVAVLLATILGSGCFGAEDAPKPTDPIGGEEGTQDGTGAQQSGPGGTEGTEATDPALARTHTIGPLHLEYALDGNDPDLPLTIETNAMHIEWTQWQNTTAPGPHWSGIDPQTKMTSGLYDGNGTARGLATWDHILGVTSGDNVAIGDPQRGTIESPEAGQWTFRTDGYGHNVHVTLVAVVSYHDG